MAGISRLCPIVQHSWHCLRRDDFASCSDHIRQASPHSCNGRGHEVRGGGRIHHSIHTSKMWRIDQLCRNGPEVLRRQRWTAQVSPLSASQVDQGEDSELNFLERLAKAWAILFPPRHKEQSNAQIARERLRLVLFSDRGEVSPEIQRALRENILHALAKYVEIESEEDIRLNVTTDPDVGTVYSVTVPVRRVRPEFQESWGDGGFRDRVWTDTEGPHLATTKFRLETQVLGDGDGEDEGGCDEGPC